MSPFLEPGHTHYKNSSLLIKPINCERKVLLAWSRTKEAQDSLDLLYQKGTRCLLVLGLQPECSWSIMFVSVLSHKYA